MWKLVQNRRLGIGPKQYILPKLVLIYRKLDLERHIFMNILHKSHGNRIRGRGWVEVSVQEEGASVDLSSPISV